MNYKFIPDLAAEAIIPEKGILSQVLQKDDTVNITLFGMAAGEEISSHSAPTSAVLHFLEGTARVGLGPETVDAVSGSFVFMPPTLPHSIAALSPVKMLLTQIKSQRAEPPPAHP